MSMWEVPPEANQYPEHAAAGDGIQQLLSKIRDIERRVDESTSNLLRTAGVGFTSTGMLLTSVPVYADNAAAITGGLVIGALYRTGADPDHLCIVH